MIGGVVPFSSKELYPLPFLGLWFSQGDGRRLPYLDRQWIVASELRNYYEGRGEYGAVGGEACKGEN